MLIFAKIITKHLLSWKLFCLPGPPDEQTLTMRYFTLFLFAHHLLQNWVRSPMSIGSFVTHCGQHLGLCSLLEGLSVTLDTIWVPPFNWKYCHSARTPSWYQNRPYDVMHLFIAHYHQPVITPGELPNDHTRWMVFLCVIDANGIVAICS